MHLKANILDILLPLALKSYVHLLPHATIEFGLSCLVSLGNKVGIKSFKDKVLQPIQAACVGLNFGYIILQSRSVMEQNFCLCL